MTFLASYLFPHGEKVIEEFIPTGFSLGGTSSVHLDDTHRPVADTGGSSLHTGHLTWRLLREGTCPNSTFSPSCSSLLDHWNDILFWLYRHRIQNIARSPMSFRKLTPRPEDPHRHPPPRPPLFRIPKISPSPRHQHGPLLLPSARTTYHSRLSRRTSICRSVHGKADIEYTWKRG